MCSPTPGTARRTIMNIGDIIAIVVEGKDREERNGVKQAALTPIPPQLANNVDDCFERMS